jgi:hypothetical protein
MAEMRSLAGSVKNVKKSYPRLYHKYEAVNREMIKLRKALIFKIQRENNYCNSLILKVD